jgi:uncharacterized membrane protein (UPF0182 family)
VGGGLLYVQPVYTWRETGAGSYPVLRYVLASFGQDAGYGTTLGAALNDVLGTTVFTGGPTTGGNQGPGGTGVPPGASQTVTSLLQQAQAKFTEAQSALRRGDLPGYAAAEADAQRLVEQALRAAQSGGSSSAPSPSSPSPTASGSPSGSASPKSQPASPKASPSSSSSG